MNEARYYIVMIIMNINELNSKIKIFRMFGRLKDKTYLRTIYETPISFKDKDNYIE